MFDIFEYRDYKEYLRTAVSRERGEQARLAKALGCQSAYLSMVLKGHAHLSLEQVSCASDFLGHDSKESHFLILLVQYERAGNDRLRLYFSRQIETALTERQNLSQRLHYQNTLTDEQRGIFYSSWYYTSIHIALTIANLQTPDAIADYLRLPLTTVRNVLDFLVKVGLAKQVGSRFEVGTTSFHLSAESPFSTPSHANLRQQAIHSLQRPQLGDFHYSSVVSASSKDLPKVREIMVQAIEQIRALVRKSPEEDLYCYNMDIFTLKG